MSRRDVDEFLDQCDDVISDWEGSVDAAGWSADGSHEVDEIGGDYYGQDRQQRGVVYVSLGMAMAGMWAAAHDPATCSICAAMRDVGSAAQNAVDTFDEFWERYRRSIDIDREYRRAARLVPGEIYGAVRRAAIDEIGARWSDVGYNARVGLDGGVTIFDEARTWSNQQVAGLLGLGTFGFVTDPEPPPTPAPPVEAPPVVLGESVLRWALQRAAESPPPASVDEAMRDELTRRGTSAQRTTYGPADRRTARR